MELSKGMYPPPHDMHVSSSYDMHVSSSSYDMDLSKDIGAAFADSQTRKELLLQNKMSSEISVHVLTTGYWPAYPPVSMCVCMCMYI
jgi:hypothetical protein